MKIVHKRAISVRQRYPKEQLNHTNETCKILDNIITKEKTKH